MAVSATERGSERAETVLGEEVDQRLLELVAVAVPREQMAEPVGLAGGDLRVGGDSPVEAGDCLVLIRAEQRVANLPGAGDIVPQLGQDMTERVGLIRGFQPRFDGR